MIRIILLCIIVIGLGENVQGQITLKKLKNALEGESVSSEEVALGLKEALTNGISKGSDLVSQVDGYFKNPEIKIPFPPEVKQVEARLRQVGMGSEVDKFILTLNRGAEDAAKEAKPIFIQAIKDYNDACLPIFSKDVLARIQSGEAVWEIMVPPQVASIIKDRKLFGFPGEQ